MDTEPAAWRVPPAPACLGARPCMQHSLAVLHDTTAQVGVGLLWPVTRAAALVTHQRDPVRLDAKQGQQCLAVLPELLHYLIFLGMVSVLRLKLHSAQAELVCRHFVE